METIVYQIELKDGRVFRVFCANKTQKRRVIFSATDNKVKSVRTITNGVHTVQQYEKLLTTF